MAEPREDDCRFHGVAPVRINCHGGPRATIPELLAIIRHKKRKMAMSSWNVPIYTQRTAEVCWEACARMMFDWRHQGNPAMNAAYTAMLAGIPLRGLTHGEMNLVYGRLGLRALPHPQGKNVRHALQWSPTIVTANDRAMGHALVIKGHANRSYVAVNPCARQEVDFDTGTSVCAAAAEVNLSEADVDDKLGHFIWYW